MAGHRQKARRVKKRQTRARKKSVQAKQNAIVPAKTDPVPMRQPRPRIRLRNALRAAGLDEWQIAWNLSVKVGQLSESKFASDKKLLLEYMKEAIRHLDPASAAAANAPLPGAPLVEVVHNVARPDRESPSG
ncbi:MAG TPA: hypothetical protein VGR94_04010 [Candidatus Acidoferrales bacterium]|nr:hypothetical protein [Candidatus Acidoferrales bacterium]